jgi:Cdc6-like AAA superfamily ATPase
MPDLCAGPWPPRKDSSHAEPTEHRRILFEIVLARKDVHSGDLWTAYLAEAGQKGLNPIALRTFSEYMNKLGEIGLVKVSRARVRGKVRLFKVVE